LVQKNRAAHSAPHHDSNRLSSRRVGKDQQPEVRAKRGAKIRVAFSPPLPSSPTEPAEAFLTVQDFRKCRFEGRQCCLPEKKSWAILIPEKVHRSKNATAWYPEIRIPATDFQTCQLQSKANPCTRVVGRPSNDRRFQSSWSRRYPPTLGLPITDEWGRGRVRPVTYSNHSWHAAVFFSFPVGEGRVEMPRLRTWGRRDQQSTMGVRKGIEAHTFLPYSVPIPADSGASRTSPWSDNNLNVSQSIYAASRPKDSWPIKNGRMDFLIAAEI